MALTSDTNPSSNGVNCIEHESAEILKDEDLEDGEIFEDVEPGEDKSSPEIPPEKLKPVQPAVVQPVVVPAVVKKPEELPKNHKVFENDKPPREQQNVPFFNRGKRKHFDDEEDNRWKRDGKRNRRSREFERDGELGKTRQDGEHGEDDEEMMFVRGASPHRLDEEMDKWDRDGEEDDRGGDMPRRPRTFRGRGGGMRRGDRQRGRGRGGRGSLRGNKRKRDEIEMCHFFLQGKCHRGSDCPYAHEIRPPRKTELCKFYMKDCCAKKEKCLYMHSEFPCKYFHTGLKCYANNKCKFNHGPLTDQMGKILANHLDTAPKDILGEFPRRDRDRDMRDGRGDPRDMRHDSRDRDMRDMRDMRNMRDMRDMRDMRGDFMRGKCDRDRKIPSLFDIKVTIPEDMRNADGNHTPMPSPTQRSQDSTKSSERDREMYSPHKERERDRERDKEQDFEKHKHEKSEKTKEERKEERKERKAKREKAREHRKERRERKEREKEKKRDRKDSLSENNDQSVQQTIKVSEIMSPNQSDADNIRSSIEGPMIMPTEKQPEDSDKRGVASDDNGLILQHLPKKQRELYLRIQQQQREAESSQASANDEDDEDDKLAEENWYSSDEETPSSSVANTSASSATNATSLPSILQGLTTGASSSGGTTTTATTASAGSGDPVMPFLNILASASAAAKPLDVPHSPAPTVPFIPPNLDFANMQSVIEALTNLQKINSANKQAELQQQPTTSTSTAAALSTPRAELAPEAARHDEPSKPEPPRVRDPRLSRMDGGDVDLRQKTVVKPPQIQSPQHDVDLRSLPFKPVQHSAASEIDASLASHSPLTWHLIPADIVKADYTSLQIQPRPGVNDPRLRRIARPPTDDLGLPRDPRQRLMDEPPPAPAPVRDPRARGPLLATPLMPPTPMLGPPPTPRYDEDHRPQFYRMDSDMRQFPPPTPRMDEEVYTPGPSRPVDPRRKQFTPRPDDIDLRPMAQRVPFVNFK